MGGEKVALKVLTRVVVKAVNWAELSADATVYLLAAVMVEK